MKSSINHPVHRSLKLRGHAAGMRGELATASERALWLRLRGGQLGVHFRRQVPLLGRFIVDFLAPGARVVVEVDGGYHGSGARQRADARRDRRLSRAGFVVVRVPAELVARDIEEVVRRVAHAVLDR